MKYFKLFLLLSILCACQNEDDDNVPIEAACDDGILNQNEVDIDCGGPCPACAIEYPPAGAHGVNILFGTDTLILDAEENSMKAIVPEGSSLDIRMHRIHGDMWFFSLGAFNWSWTSFENDQQTFTVIQPGTADLEILTEDPNTVDTFLVQYFENGDVLTRQKVVIWD